MRRQDLPQPEGDAAVLAAVERAMLRIRRSQSRRTLGRLAAQELGRPVDASHFLVVDAVEEGPERPGQEVTVGVVAERLGIDPSRASRMVAGAVRAGYVARAASQADGRRIRLELTAAGRELAEAAHRFRRAAFRRAMRGWPAAERRAFARLLTKFTEGLEEAGWDRPPRRG